MSRRIEYKEGYQVGNFIYLKEGEPIMHGGSLQRRAYLRCKCGVVKLITLGNARFATKSCGCRIGIKERPRKTKRFDSEYIAWVSMRGRCNNPNNKAYHHYGGRGIGVCREWDSFDQFLIDMGAKPSSKHSLDRIRVNESYCKSNCRWATPDVQSENKRNTRLITHDGVTMCLSRWAKKLKIARSVLEQRLKNGYPLEKALSSEGYRSNGQIRPHKVALSVRWDI